MCNLSKEKCLFFLFHFHTHTLYLFIYTAPFKLKHSLSLCLVLSETHIQNAEWLSVFFSLPQGRMALVSFFLLFFSFSVSHMPCITSQKREVRPLPCFDNFSINERVSFEDFWNKLINELWLMCVLECKGCHVHSTEHPNITNELKLKTPHNFSILVPLYVITFSYL